MKSQQMVKMLEAFQPLLDSERARAVAEIAELLKTHPNTETKELLRRLRFLKQAKTNEGGTGGNSY